VVASVWLSLKGTPKQGMARTLFILARVCVIGVWLAILSAITLFYVSVQRLGSTREELLYERESPNGLYVVAAFNRYGGAVVRNTTKISIRSKYQELDTRNNAIIFDEDMDKPKDLEKPVDVAWDGNSNLIIRTDYRHISYQVTKWGDITITYVMK
jgi:hypothetical protein